MRYLLFLLSIFIISAILDFNLLMLIFILYCIAAAIQLFFYLWFYLAPAFYKHNDSPRNELPPLSVIICARNESANLKRFLPLVLEQDYPSFEVIVVNDCSEDDTYQVLGEMLSKYQNLKISTINKDPSFSHSKKFAQFIGIKAASNELLVFTDADCYPVSDKWLRMMASGFSKGIDFVIGYGGFIAEKGLLNRYQRYEAMFIAMQYLGMAIRGIAYMAVGRNFAYRKDVFFRNKGFGRYNHIASGDDDLFVNRNARASSVKVEFRKDAHTRSPAAHGLNEWANRRMRHMTTARYYKLIHKILLVAEPLSRLIFYITFIWLILDMFLWQYVAGIFLIRLAIMFATFYTNMKKLDEKGLLPFILIFDLFSPLINIILYSGTLREKSLRKAWK